MSELSPLQSLPNKRLKLSAPSSWDPLDALRYGVVAFRL
jgi:hypothetical protein